MIDEENPEWTEEMFARAIRGRVRERIMAGQIESGDEIAALRRFVNLTQEAFAESMGISVFTLRGWEQGQRKPNGAAIALLRIVARHPGILRENLPPEKREASRVTPEEIETIIKATKARAARKPSRRPKSPTKKAA